MVEADLVEALQEFGPISYVVVMPKKRQALVEFEDVLGACNAVNFMADNQIYIASPPSFCQLLYQPENLPSRGSG